MILVTDFLYQGNMGNQLLVFEREDMLEEQVIRYREGKEFVETMST